jgi:glycosyltransferase involved in cell wall biosynthesis
MKILFTARAFLPQIGGLENTTYHLADELVRMGHEVVVLTTTPGDGPDTFPFRVIRCPGPWETLRWMRWCDVVHQPNLSLKGVWPRFVVRRPWIVSHHSWYRRSDGRIAWQDRLKRRVLRKIEGSVAVSRAMADDLAPPPLVINNAFQDKLFRRLPEVEKSEDLVFLGRLVSDKGIDVLLDALAYLASKGLRPGLTVIGEGPERPGLEVQARRLGLAEQVRFLGTRKGEELVEILNRHRILVAPSRYREPFGTVALEGLACGCAVVGSADGGLIDAMGPCGRTFPNGDAAALADVLADLLSSPEKIQALLARVPEHLANHTGASIARAYADLFERARRGFRP